MAELMRYEAARRALAEAHRIDEVKEIRDKAIAMQAYAKQAQDRELIDLATEIRLRAEIRAGEMLHEMSQRGERSYGGRPSDKTSSKPELVSKPQLADLGVTKKQSHNWQKLAAMSKEQQETTIKNAKLPDKKRRPRKSLDEEIAAAEAYIAKFGDVPPRAKFMREFGLSPTGVHAVITAAEAKAKAAVEAKKPLTLAARQKQALEREIARQTAKLEKAFEERWRSEMQKALDETVLPQYHKELQKMRDQVSYLRKGVMTAAQYKEVWTCLHPDRVQDPMLRAKYTKCFQLWAELEIVLVKEAEMPLPPTAVPRTFAEMMAARAKMRERRSQRAAKSKGATVSP